LDVYPELKNITIVFKGITYTFRQITKKGVLLFFKLCSWHYNYPFFFGRLLAEGAVQILFDVVTSQKMSFGDIFKNEHAIIFPNCLHILFCNHTIFVVSIRTQKVHRKMIFGRTKILFY